MISLCELINVHVQGPRQEPPDVCGTGGDGTDEGPDPRIDRAKQAVGGGEHHPQVFHDSREPGKDLQ